MYSAQGADRRKPQFATEVHYRFAVTAALEPSVILRVMEMFAQRDLIPDRFNCRRTGGPEPALHIEVCVAGLDRQQAEHLALRMRNIMPVTSVMLDWD